MQNELGDPI